MKKETIISIALVTISVIIIIIGGVVINNNSGKGLTKEEKTESYIKLIDDSITLPIGEEYDFNADIESFSGKNLVFSSSKPEIVKIDRETGILNTLALGEAVITVSFANDDSISKNCVVKVVESKIEEKVKLKNIYFDRDVYNIYVGDTASLNVMFNPTNASDKGLTWVSSNTKVVSINNGIVKGIIPGEAIITVKSHDGGFEANTKVIVKQADKKAEVSSISLNTDKLDLYVGESIRLNVTINPENATNRQITWLSNNPGVANVGSDGVIRAVNEGNAIITAKSSNGKTANCKVTVTKKATVVEVESINILSEVLNLDLNNSMKLDINITPPNATDKTITWSSSDSSIVSVDDKGIVFGKKVGTATITAKSNNGKTSTCKVTVTKDDIQVNSVSLNVTNMRMDVGDTMQIFATVLPPNATNQDVTWSSNDPTVASVKDGIITALKKGSTTITVTTKNGKKATCKVEVIDGTTIEVEEINLKEKEKTIDVGKSYMLFYTLTPSNATGGTMTWTSTNEAVVTVKNGIITGIKEGNAIIYVRTENGKVDSCNVTVEDKNLAVESISLNRTSLDLKVGDTFNLRVAFVPSDASNKTITWTSSNPSVATVSSKGVVTAVAKGNATITAKSHNGKTAISRINVSE